MAADQIGQRPVIATLGPAQRTAQVVAATGQRLGIVTNEVFGVIVIVVILSTLLTPPILTYIVRRNRPVDGPLDDAVVPLGA